MLSLLGGVYSYLSGLCENRYESSCKKLLDECISAVLAGFIGMYLAEYMNRPGFPGECFICELRLPDHRF
ncbi:phage holin family protein [Escherichia coli]|uniref:phage holin family protein n=1 Tax=Escherichia coli TaxID=562 RepID=UPI00202257C9|nr:phage holin family protein [Escherichia coli]